MSSSSCCIMALWTLTLFLTLLSQKILIITNIKFSKCLTCFRWPVDMVFFNTNIVRLFLLYSKKGTCASSLVLFLLSAGERKLQDERNEQQLSETEEILAPVVEVLHSGLWICLFSHEKSNTVKECWARWEAEVYYNFEALCWTLLFWSTGLPTGSSKLPENNWYIATSCIKSASRLSLSWPFSVR